MQYDLWNLILIQIGAPHLPPIVFVLESMGGIQLNH